MKKCIVSGIVKSASQKLKGVNGGWILNGDIETDKNSNEVYIESRRKEGSNEIEDVFYLVSEMDLELQKYITENKKWIDID